MSGERVKTVRTRRTRSRTAVLHVMLADSSTSAGMYSTQSSCHDLAYLRSTFLGKTKQIFPILRVFHLYPLSCFELTQWTLVQLSFLPWVRSSHGRPVQFHVLSEEGDTLRNWSDLTMPLSILSRFHSFLLQVFMCVGVWICMCLHVCMYVDICVHTYVHVDACMWKPKVDIKYLLQLPTLFIETWSFTGAQFAGSS